LASILGAIGGEGGRQAAEDTKYETPAQVLGGLLGGIAAMKTPGAPRPTGITPRGTIAPTVPPKPPRQTLAEASEQGVPNPRAGKDLGPLAEDNPVARAGQLAQRDEIVAQPPTRPPDQALPRNQDKPPDRLDATKTATEPRPSGGVLDSGEAIWNLGWAARGQSIEQALGRSPDLHYAYPTKDRFSNGVATSIKSIDLNAPTYQDKGRLTAKLNKLVDEVAAFNHEQG